MKHDALDLGREPDPPQTPLEDLLEVSDKVYHKAMTKVQIALRARYESVMDELATWAAAQLEGGANAHQVDFMTDDHLVKTRGWLRKERDSYQQRYLIEKFLRDEGIRRHHERETNPG